MTGVAGKPAEAGWGSQVHLLVIVFFVRKKAENSKPYETQSHGDKEAKDHKSFLFSGIEVEKNRVYPVEGMIKAEDQQENVK